MIAAIKDFAKRHWPKLGLRAILFGTLLFVAALPGVAALFLRVYENAIVQQTEAELIAQGAVLASAYKVAWREGAPATDARRLAPEAPTIDLRSMTILPPAPPGVMTRAPDPQASRVASALLPVVIDAGAVTLASIRLLDGHGIVVVGRGDVGQDRTGLVEVRRALHGRPATVLRARGAGEADSWVAIVSRAYAIRVHHARPVIAQGRVIGIVMLSRTPRGVFIGIYRDRWAILIGIGLIFGALLVIVALLSRGIARPIDALSKASAGVALGRVDIPETPLTAAIEIAGLYDNFRAMAERIDRRSRYLRDFAAAVSHEFKTPIAGIRGALELLDEHGATMSAEERRRFIDNASADADRLARLVQRLLDLARADMTTIEADARCDVAGAVARIATGAEGRAPAIVAAIDERLPAARITPEVFETIIETLIDNSRQAGATRVGIAGTLVSGEVTLTIDDDGSGVSDSDRERIFEPFFTGRRLEGGAGLGLPIVRSLLAATGGTITCMVVPRGARFVLCLPLATSF